MTEHDTLRHDWREDWILMNALHDAFRRDLEQLLDATADDAVIRSRWRLFRDQLHFHHTAEDKAMWPPVRAKLAGNPGGLALMDQMEAEHAQIDPLLAAIDDALGTRGGRERARPLLTRARGILADHLAHEEAEALPLISSVMTQAELGQIGRAIARMGGLRQVAVMFPWALSEATPVVREQVLGQLPAPARLLYRAVWLPRYRRRVRRP
jgi:hemerythrin HHE cation binding domain-containing protein